MIHFRAKVLFAACETDSPITRGSVGIPVEFEFSPEWDGLSKIAVYRGSGISVDQALTEGTGTVPSNVMTGVGGDLYIGVYGRNAAGTIVMPTIWAKVGRIQPGAKPSSVDPAEPEPDWTAQVQAKAENALAVAKEALQKAEEGGTGLSDDVKQALLQLAQKVAYVDDKGQTYYNDLYNALYPPADLVSISATFNQGNTVVYDTASLDSLKPMLTVTAHYDDGSTASVAGYTLSGSLTAGTSTITVAYQGKTATFTVTVTHKEAVLTGISAVFTQGSHTVYSGDSLDTLKPYLVVSASWDDGTSSTVDSYTLSGTLTTGTSTITVAYGGKTDTFTVTVTERPATLTSISAVFDQGDNVIYDTDALDSLKQYLTVTATYSDSSTATVPSADYTLSGTLAEGTSTITVAYSGKSTTFNATVTHYDVGWDSGVPYNIEYYRGYVTTVGTGELSENSGWSTVEDMIPCHGVDILMKDSTQPEKYIFYDENGNFLRNADAQYSAGGSTKGYNVNVMCVPADAYYFRLNVRGTTASPVITPVKLDVLTESTVFEFGKRYALNWTRSTASSVSDYALVYGAAKMTIYPNARSFVDYVDGNKSAISTVIYQNEAEHDVASGAVYFKYRIQNAYDNPFVVLDDADEEG